MTAPYHLTIMPGRAYYNTINDCNHCYGYDYKVCCNRNFMFMQMYFEQQFDHIDGWIFPKLWLTQAGRTIE